MGAARSRAGAARPGRRPSRRGSRAQARRERAGPSGGPPSASASGGGRSRPRARGVALRAGSEKGSRKRTCAASVPGCAASHAFCRRIGILVVDGDRSCQSAFATCEGPDRRALPRFARCAGARPGCAAFLCALQPGVPSRVRRDAAPVPLDPPPGAGRSALAVDRPQRRRHLLHGWLAQRWIVYDEFRPDVRLLANRLPCSASARHPSCSDPDLRAAGVGASAIEQFSRRQGDGLGLTSLSTC